ncbi:MULTISPECIES: DUF5362 family protein [unclassified Guyparkeria]|uniref:DUF5362 family protein n=1 Tax=unclassified Guyparkeria TaxID=2626246 RepID=UPI0007339403|nr:MULTISPECIES: DUF5362 family protein [unclassified Guyparkeria]KTG17980.1 hypothetical protein AUR63_00090 [Guyparkeria sp. XI15]OAE89690.1 hypothetical protein AWR35_00090 [Guyparkeria sp. WRN-7]
MEAQPSATDIRSIIEPLARGKFWMQLIGVMMIIYGAITALSIVGIIIAWIPIWAGVVLMQAAGAIHRAYTTNEPQEASYAMGKIRIYFTIFGVLTLLGLVMMIVSMIFGIGAGMMGAASF